MIEAKTFELNLSKELQKGPWIQTFSVGPHIRDVSTHLVKLTFYNRAIIRLDVIYLDHHIPDQIRGLTLAAKLWSDSCALFPMALSP